MLDFPDVRRWLDSLPARAALPSSLGWVLAHCAQSVEYSMSGFPELRSGAFRATIGPIVLWKFLRDGAMSHDLAAPIPGAPDIPAGLPFDAGLGRLRHALDTFDAYGGPLAPHFAYGAVTREQYLRVHALHVGDHARGLGLA